MSILIKGMRMPTNCCQCPVNMEVCKMGYKYLLAHPELYDKRADDCPLVPVSPHGRLIDADAFCEKILEIVERQKYDDFYTKSLSVGEILRAVVTELRGEGLNGFCNAPTIIPASGGKENE